MRHKILIWLCFAVFSWAEVLTPQAQIVATGNVIDLVVQEGLVVAGTDAGTLEVYDKNSLSLLKKIEFEPIKDFMGDPMKSKVFSVDKIESKDHYLVMLQSPTSYRRVVIVDGNTQNMIIDEDDHYMIKKAKFIDESHILLGLLSNELILYDIDLKKEIYRFQITESHFSDFALGEDKLTVASADESGKVYLLDTKSGKLLKTYKGGNVDNIYKVGYHQKRIITAGQDRRSIVYDVKSGSFDRYNANFLIYACAISPSENLGAIAISEDNAIGIFDLNTGRQMHTLKGQKSTLNTIAFVNKKELFSASDDRFILKWRLP